MSDGTLTYAGGAEELIAQWNTRREPFEFLDDDLPLPDTDFEGFVSQRVTEEATTARAHKSKWTAKRCQIAGEFVGRSELAFLNAQLIAILRRQNAPEKAVTLFRRLWAEQPEHLLQELDLRWQVSSMITFADHGEASLERELGSSFKMLFGLIKLYEFERLFSGQRPENPWRFGHRSDAAMPLEMDQYSLNNGGLDIALLAPLFEQAQNCLATGQLALNLLNALNADSGTVFRRLNAMKARRQRAQTLKERDA